MNFELVKAFERQINLELSASYDFFIISNRFSAIFMSTFSKSFEKLAHKKVMIAKKLCNYLILREENFNYFPINEQNRVRKNASDFFSHACFQEEFLHGEMIKLSQTALKVNDYRAYQFLREILSNFCFYNKNLLNNGNNRAFGACKRFDRV